MGTFKVSGRTTVAAILTIAAASFCLPNTTAAQTSQGSKLRVIVGFPAGGGIDTVARLIFRHFAKHNGGNSPVIQNMPGAGGMISVNYTAARAPKDGSVITFDSGSPAIAQLTKQKSVRFDYSKLSIVGAVKGGTYLMFTRKAVIPGGLNEPAEILKANGAIFAGQNPRLVLDIYGRLALNLLGVNYKYVSGYRGAPARFLAIRRNEADIATVALQGYRAAAEPRMVKNGHAVPLWYFASEDAKGMAVADKDIPDMPMFREVYKKAKGKDPSGSVWQALQVMNRISGKYLVIGPPGMNKAALERLRKVFTQTAADPNLRQEYKKILGFELAPIPVEEMQAVYANLSKLDPGAVAEITKLMK